MIKLRSIFLFILLFTFISKHVTANDSLSYTIKINFLYGSKPAKGYKKSESKLFGGIKGGHVNIQAGNRVLDFMPGNNPLLPNKHKPTGGFRLNQCIYWDTTSTKWKSVVVPVSSEQYTYLQRLFDSLSSKTPYDYAIFGMRCAAASYDVLSDIGLFEKMPNPKNISKHFYPKLLRKKVLKWAEENHYTIINKEGRQSRKWESDKGLL
jgi:hypothetical protein